MANLPTLPSSLPNTTTNTSLATPQTTQGGASAPNQASVPTQGYFPRAALHLVVRFDEFGDTGPLRKAAPTTTTKNLNGTTVNRSGLTAQVDPTAPSGVTRYVIGVPSSDPGGGGPQNRTQSSDGLTWDFTAIPKSVTWSQNGLRKAATLQVALKFIDLPFDPRMCRSVAVELLLGCVDYETAALEASGDWQGQDAPVIPRTYTGPYGEPRTNLRFQGFVDSWENEWDDGEPTVTLECTDNTQLLIDQEHSPRVVLNMNQPIDQAIAGYLANYVQFAGMSVEYRPSGDSPPVLNNVLAGTAYRPNLGPTLSRSGAATGASKASTWDYLTEVCGSVAHSIRVDGTVIVIQRVRSIMAKSTSPRPDDPFTPRTVDGRSYPSRTLIYGSNLKKLKFSRNLRRHAPQNVECRSYSQSQKKVLVARFPQVSPSVSSQETQMRALPGNTQPDQKWTVIQVSGIESQTVLNQIAQEYYESVGRQELKVDAETENMASFGGGNTDPDILDMKFGDQFQLFVDRGAPARSSVNQIEQYLTATQRASSFFQSLGFTQQFSDQYARNYTNAGFQYAFRMHEMRISWDGEKGCQISLSGVNYVEVRADQALPPGQEPGNTSGQSQSSTGGVTPGNVGALGY